MKPSSIMRLSAFLVTSAMFCAGVARALVLHPGGEPDMDTWLDHPSTSVVGRWNYGGSCVVVSSNCVLTTRHQGGGIGTTVTVDGQRYTVERIWNHDEADLRVARLAGARFSEHADIYEGRDEPGKQVVMAGFGFGRGQDVQNQQRTYGYEWAEGSYGVLRMGTNRVDSTADASELAPYVSDVIRADFDGLGVGQSTIYEATTASYDSGGGWFIKSGGQWQVAGLARGIEAHYESGHDNDPDYVLWESWFANRERPLRADPDQIDAVRLSSYAEWIEATLCQARSGDLDCNERVDIADLAILAEFWGDHCDASASCGGADLNDDGRVDYADMALLSLYWLEYDIP